LVVNANPRGVVIFGVPRSGTTLLRTLVDAHPSFACPGESFLLTAAAKFLSSQPFAHGLDIGVLTGLTFLGFDPDEVIERLRAFVFQFHREHAARAGKPRWAEKTAPDVFHLREIEALCGDEVDYVCIVRHALDVMVSLVELVDSSQRWSVELHPYIVRSPRPLEALAHAWVDGTQAMLDLVARRPERAHILRYEELAAQPAVTMGRLMDALGESWPEGLERGALVDQRPGLGDWKIFSRPAVESTSVGRGRAALTPITVSELAPIVNPTLVAAGYDALPEAPRPTRERARRLFEAAMKVQALRRR
jgi:protein-tyrosine sulfotransferase